MTKLRFMLLGALLTLARTAPAAAAECEDFQFAETISDGTHRLVLNGIGLRRAFRFVKVYVAGLYVPQKTANPAEIMNPATPHTLVLHMMHGATKAEMVEAWTKGFKDNAPREWPSIEPRITALEKAVPLMRKGDEVWFRYRPGEGVTFIVNGKAGGRMEGEDFARALFSIYVGPKPPNEGLKTGVLGGTCD